MKSNSKPLSETPLAPEMFQQVVEQHHPSLYRYYAVHTNGDLDAALQMTIQTFAAIYDRPATSIKQSFASWLFGVAWDVLNTQSSRAARRPSPGSLRAWKPEAETVRMFQSLRSLTFYARETLYLRFFAGLSPRDIALMMDRSETTIKTLVYQALMEFDSAMNQVDYIVLPRAELIALAETYHIYLNDLLAGRLSLEMIAPNAARASDQLNQLREALRMRSDAGAYLITEMERVIQAGNASTTRL